MAKDPSKTEKPTEKRLDKARKDGNVPLSQELSKATVLLAGVVMLRIFIGYFSDKIKSIFVWFYTTGLSTPAQPEAVYNLVVMVFLVVAKILLPFLLFIFFVAFITNYLQIGWLWTTKVFVPKPEKFLNPINGLKKFMVNLDTVVRLGKTIGQAIILGIVPYFAIKGEIHKLLPLFYQPVDAVAAFILGLGFKMVVYSLVPVIIIAVLDVVYTRWKYIEDQKMSKDEVKDERKQMEGDPKVRQKQKEKMMQSMAARMLPKVPEADVVITNPTHYAVALRYNALEAPAPLVLAKGVDHMARKIKDIALENNVPIRENAPLARALYEQVELGDIIPEELYQAVATILAQLARFKRPAPPPGS